MRQQQQLHNPDAQNHSFSTGTQHNQLTDGRTLARYGSLTSSDALFDALFLDSTVNNRRPTGSDTRVVGSGEIDGRARWSPYAHSRCRTVKSVTFSLFAFPVTDVLSANGSHWEILCWYWLWNPRKNGRVSLEKNVNLVVLPNHQENHEIARFHSRNLKLLENFTLL